MPSMNDGGTTEPTGCELTWRLVGGTPTIQTITALLEKIPSMIELGLPSTGRVRKIEMTSDQLLVRLS